MPTVLVVEDDTDLLASIRLVLREAGYFVVTVENGAEALQMLNALRPDVLLTDLMMPVMNGWDLIGHVRLDEGLRSIPVIVMTAGEDEPPLGTHPLKKPIGIGRLLAAIEGAAAR